RVQLADPALAGARGLPRMEERLGGALIRRLHLERAVHLLDRPLRVGNPAADDARDVPALVWQFLARAVGARDLEQRDVVGVPDGDVVPYSLDEARNEPGAQRRRLDRERLRQANLAVC